MHTLRKSRISEKMKSKLELVKYDVFRVLNYVIYYVCVIYNVNVIYNV